jgi:hypothetical protein
MRRRSSSRTTGWQQRCKEAATRPDRIAGHASTMASPSYSVHNAGPERSAWRRVVLAPVCSGRRHEDEHRSAAMPGVRRSRARGQRADSPLHRGLAGLLGRLRRALGKGSRRLPLHAPPPADRGRLLRWAPGDSFPTSDPVCRRAPRRPPPAAGGRAVRRGALWRPQADRILGQGGKAGSRVARPPASPAEITVLHLLGAKSPEEYGELARVWAWSVWESWSEHHETVRRWASV